MPGTMKPVSKKANPGLAKLPTNVRNKMGYMQKGGKVTKKYSVGGMGPPDEQFFDPEELKSRAKKPTFAQMTQLDERDKREMAIQERVREKAKEMTFGEAFKKARAAGEKVFEYPKGSGKMFTTETAEEKAKRLAAKKKKAAQTDTGAADRTPKAAQTDTGAADRTPKKVPAKAAPAKKEATKKEPPKKEAAKKEEPKPVGKREMSKFSQMSFSEQLEFLRTRGKENMGDKTKMMKGGTATKKMMGGGYGTKRGMK
jgi:hypothetical protein